MPIFISLSLLRCREGQGNLFPFRLKRFLEFSDGFEGASRDRKAAAEFDAAKILFCANTGTWQIGLAKGRMTMPVSVKQAREVADQYREEGYALLRQFIDGDKLRRLRAETAAVYQEGLKHPRTWRHGNLSFEFLPEEDFGERYVIQEVSHSRPTAQPS